MAPIRGDKTLPELALQYDIHPNQIQDCKERLTAEAGSLFEGGGSATNSPIGDTVSLTARGSSA